MPGVGFASVNLPSELYAEIERIVKARKYGYVSISDFVRDAVRDKLAEIAKIKTFSKNNQNGSDYIDADSNAEILDSDCGEDSLVEEGDGNES